MARNHPGIGPYSRALRRGIGHTALNGRTAIGRYARDLENQLIKHAGGPNATRATIPVTTVLLIDRIVRATIQIDSLDCKLDAGDSWSDHDSRTHNGLINRQRLLLRELGMTPAAARPRRFSDYLPDEDRIA